MGLCKTSGFTRRHTDKNPKNILNSDQKRKIKVVFQIKYQKQTPHACVCFEKQIHKASQCESVKNVEARRLILSKKKLCLTALGKNKEPLIAIAINYALLITQNTILSYMTKIGISF